MLLICLLLPVTTPAATKREPASANIDPKAALVEQCPRGMPKRCACVEHQGGIRVIPVLQARKGGAKILWIGPRPKQ
jgi:hypothetical protein